MTTSQDTVFFILISTDIFFPEYSYFDLNPVANENVATENWIEKAASHGHFLNVLRIFIALICFHGNIPNFPQALFCTSSLKECVSKKTT